MLKNNLLVLCMVLFIGACATGKPRVMGVDGSDIPPAFASFPDIPFPDKSYIDPDETRALGSGESWTGSIVFTAPYDMSSVFDFYMSEMPKFRWTEVAVVRAKISHMTYTRDNRAVQILFEKKMFDNTKVTLTAIPNKAAYRY